MAAPNLQTAAGPDFGDGAFQPQANVTIHGATNLEVATHVPTVASVRFQSLSLADIRRMPHAVVCWQKL